MALAHAAALAEIRKGLGEINLVSTLTLLISVGKKWNEDKTAPKLEQASSTIKAIYRLILT